MNVEMGLWSPVPWYYFYFQAADRANCPPWDLIDDWTPREFWAHAATIVSGAESDHLQYRQAHPERFNPKTKGDPALGPLGTA